MTRYAWKPESRITLDAQAAGEEIERIRVARNGRLTSEAVVEEAKDEASPLHPAFEWDNDRAAHQYRVTQAAHLIRSITLVADSRPGQPEKPVRAFVNVTVDEDRSYTSVAHALSDEALRAQVLSQAWKEIEAWKRKYSDLVEFARLFGVIEELKDENAA
ncbi:MULTISPECIES: hypothetical protein [Hyphobacterium]|uniref:Uncharacterized protein n=1 Tax=Hyphobacterium vulgare TaxID=1736751 RepID=A0ABV6ZU74_9PROT